MPPTLENIVPWGRSFDEYQRMFSLDSNDLRGSILGFADGPASFNAELTEMGKSVVSFDPIYQFTAAEIGSRIEAVAPRMIDYAAQHADEFVWTSRLPDVTTLAKQRRQAMSRFLDDFADGLDAGRYVAAEVAVPLTKRAAARWAFARSRWSLESIEGSPRILNATNDN
jgi:hypothetical protein